MGKSRRLRESQHVAEYWRMFRGWTAIDPKLDVVRDEDDRTVVIPELVIPLKGSCVRIAGRCASTFSRRGGLVAIGLHRRPEGAARSSHKKIVTTPPAS